jgi:hypothetical protein
MTLYRSGMSSDNDHAVLLGAIFGDGYIQKRCQNYKTVVTSGNQYLGWFNRIDDLFESVFGHRPYSYEKKPSPNESEETKAARVAGYVFCEKYLTISEPELRAKIGIIDKYLPGRGFGTPNCKMVSVPAWVDADENAVRSFLIGLSETDGWFKYARDKRSPNRTWSRFGIAQKDDGLASWAASALRAQGFTVVKGWFEDAGTWQVRVNEQAHVKRLGEWFGSSSKYAAMLASGPGPATAPVNRKTGEPLAGKPAQFWPNIPRERQALWRELRETGMSLDKISAAFGVSKNTIWVPTRDIVPEARLPPADADCVLKAYEKKITSAIALGGGGRWPVR